MTRGPFWYTKRIHRALPKGITFTISKNLLGAIEISLESRFCNMTQAEKCHDAKKRKLLFCTQQKNLSMGDNMASNGFENLLRESQLPIKYYDKEFVLCEKLREEENNFLERLEMCSGVEFGESRNDEVNNLIQRIEHTSKAVFGLLRESLNSYEKSDVKKAQESFDQMMTILENELFISTIDDTLLIQSDAHTIRTHIRMTQGREYYRVRAISSINQRFRKKEMFHVPLKQRQKTSNCRFNLAGFPVLYLSTMLPLAWQECEYPKKYAYSIFRSPYVYDKTKSFRLWDKEFHYISLYSPIEIVNWGTAVKYNDLDLWLTVIERYLKMYPLILACSFINYQGDAPYKQEYIIPQMLMQWVKRNWKKYQGVSYFTCLDLSSITSGWCAYNIAVPAIPEFHKDGLSGPLKKNFIWEKPKIVDCSINKERCKDELAIIEKVASSLSKILRTKQMASCLQEYLFLMQMIIDSFRALIIHGNETKMEVLIHSFCMIEENIKAVREVDLDSLKAKAKADPYVKEQAFNLDEIDQISKDFYGEGIEGSIYQIVNQLRFKIWRDI